MRAARNRIDFDKIGFSQMTVVLKGISNHQTATKSFLDALWELAPAWPLAQVSPRPFEIPPHQALEMDAE